MTSLSSQPLPVTAEKQVTGCTKSLVFCRVEIHLWRLIIHISNTGHDMTSCYQVPCGLSVSLLYGWWHTDSSASLEWWGLMVYVSAVGSAASAWAGRVSITFITFVGWEMLDWFWIGTHSYTLTSFIKLKPLALIQCHWLCDIHQANTSPTYYIRYQISSVKRTWHCLW